MPQPPSPPPAPNPGSPPPRRFRETALASGLVTAGQIDLCEAEVVRSQGITSQTDPGRWDRELAARMVHRKQITPFQAEQLLAGKSKLTLGQYVILDELGRGGMGQVFRAHHALMRRMVAIKVLPRQKSNAETESAFQREIQMLARLDHENLVRALDAGHDGKVYYLVTELIPGLNLRCQVHDHGCLDETTAASVISQAAQGLAYAHAEGLVHRDVKPSNLLVTPEGRVKVLDLGLAGSVLDEEATRLGRVVGTMDYMAPEQIRSPDTVGPPADVYALGCTLYFALTGKVPFPGGTRQDKAKRQQSEEPRPIRQLRPGVDEGMCRVVEAMMRKDPRARLQSAVAVIEALQAWCPQQPVPMPRGQLAQPAKVARAAGAFPGSVPPSRGDGGASDPSQSSQQIMRGASVADDETLRSTGSAGTRRPKAAGTAVSHEVSKNQQSSSMARRAGRFALRGLRCIAIAAVIGTVVTVATRQAPFVGPRGGEMAGWAAFWVSLSWQARALFGQADGDSGGGG